MNCDGNSQNTVLVKTHLSQTPAQTLELGQSFARSLQPGDIVALVGPLGAGKTQFVKGLAAGLGIPADVTSPTFTLIHEYAGGRLPLYHADFYRLEAGDEALAIGIEEYFAADGVVVIEWADKFPQLIPAGARWLWLSAVDEQTRSVREGVAP